jgi:hypothetical protein
VNRTRVAVLGGLALGALAGGAVAGEIGTAAPLALATKAATPTSRLRIGGQKFVAPQFQRTEAGVGLSLTDRLTLQLNYERGAYAPMMHQDHDDGLLTRLKLAF